MRLRLPDVNGYIEHISTRAYRLMNWTDVMYREIHCDGDCLKALVKRLQQWLALPKCFSEGFFCSEGCDMEMSLEECQESARLRNVGGGGRPRTVTEYIILIDIAYIYIYIYIYTYIYIYIHIYINCLKSNVHYHDS